MEPQAFQYYDKEELLTFLDDLRDSGVVNMFGATGYILEAFAMEKHEAREVLVYWMNTYSERHD